MISKILTINDFGIFTNYKCRDDLKPFSRYNIIYGWNGSGKTTLSRLFRWLELKEKHADYPNAKFVVELNDNSKVDENISKHINIKVFNTDFIQKNINLFDSKLEPVVFLSEEKIQEKIQLESLKKLKDNLLIEIDNKKKEEAILQNSIDSFHKDAGKQIKDFFLGTVHANVTYNKSTSVKIWDEIKEKGTTLDEFILTSESISQQKNFILLNSKKNDISFRYPIIDLNIFNEVQNKLIEIINYKIVNTVIERLQKNPEINKWVFEGLQLHSKSNLKCEFCGQSLPENRLSILNNHFNDEYKQLISKLKDLRLQVESLFLPPLNDLTNDLFDFLKINYHQVYFNRLEDFHKQYNDLLIRWINTIEKKIENPFYSFNCENGSSIVKNYNEFARQSNEEIIQNHNKHVIDYEVHSKETREKIEKHFVAQKVNSDDLRTKESNLLIITNDLKSKTETDIKEIEKEIEKIEGVIKNDGIAIEEINRNMSKFLGTKEIILRRKEEGGYQLIRNDIIAKNLSEGEKTVIALVYFMSKLKENNNDIKNSIIVFDDPISSFDSNHLFNASSFIMNNITESCQLFILTHNFWFFKLIRDWLKRNNNELNLYSIKNKSLRNAEKSLDEYHSEYHFLFDSLVKLKNEKQEYSLSDSFAIANYSRRILESFNSFKTPSNSGFKALLKLANEKGISKQVTDKIYYFLNKYSHLDRIETHENTIENIDAEGLDVIEGTLNIIKELDQDHYNSMMEAIDKKNLH